MTVWYPMYTTQMANNFVKWWKTKFLSGYKQFTVECNDDHISDTEELLERTTSEYDFGNKIETSCTTPPIENYFNENKKTPSSPKRNENPPPKVTDNLLNVEEFSCDVSLEEGPDKNKGDRKEFSFTLYDFDGRGKVTKDDITGLVTTIYEALGSSIKVPHFGSKTIKVKLTVSPNLNKSENEAKYEEKQEDVLNKKDFNVTIKHVSQEKKKHCRYHQKQKEPKTHYCCRKMQETNDVDSSDDYSDICSNISSDEDETEIFSNSRTCKTSVDQNQKKHNKHSNSDARNNVNVASNDCTDGKQPNFYYKTKKKRSMSLQRQELLEILQANMDKNNLSFHTKRKTCTDHVVLDSQKPQQQSELKPHKHRHKNVRLPNVPFQCLANMINPTHFYVDLAALQNTTKLPNTSCQYNQLIDAVMCVSNKQTASKKPEGCHRHVRLNSPELTNNNNNNNLNYPFQYHLVDSSFILPKVNRKSRKNCDLDTTPAVKKNIRKFPQVVLGHTSSPHHLRHRNRQEDKARAMAQVVRWLEQEFSSNFHSHERKEKQKDPHKNQQDDKNEASPIGNSANVAKHEHHHVHEHIHHHYHHYQETPVVV